MKKNILSLAALLIASAAVFTACSSDDNVTDQQPAQPAGQQVYTMTIQATKATGDAAATRGLSLDGKTLNATWATTENIYVKKGETWATGSLQPQTDGTTATLKGTLSGITIAASDVLTLQFPRSGALDYTGQVGTLADIAAKYDYATATVTVASVSATGNINPTEATTTFENQQAIVKFTLIDKADGSTPLNAMQLTVNDGTTDYTVTPASATSEIYVAIPGIADKTVTLTATVGSDTYTYEKTNVTFTNGKYYAITVKMTKPASVPEGALSGKFTVASGKQVYFSKGNLQYQASSKTWRFAEHQYDFVGDATNGNVSVGSDKSDNASINSSYTGWIDLFGWGTSGKSFTSGYGSAYHPWSKSTSSSSAYGPNGTNNLTGDYANGDWGVNMDGGWRTLSKAEWVYLFKTRTVNGGTGSGKSYTRGKKVNNVLGVVLYPDDYTGAAYTGANWSTFESAGCVFLPAAGWRNGTEVKSVGSYGAYWSSTAYGTEYAYHVYFYSESMTPDGYNGRSSGYSVRLVRPVK